MRPLVVVLAVLLAGCAQPPPPVDEAPAERHRPAGDLDATRVDLLELVQGGPDALHFVAFRATEGTYLSFREAREVFHHQRGEASCGVSFVTSGAPVEALAAVAAGEDVEVPPWDLGGGGYGGGGASGPFRLGVRVAGQELLDSPGGSGITTEDSGGGSSQLHWVEAGTWILFAAGVYGAEPGTYDPDSHWSLELRHDRPLERVDLPPAPLLCGLGFDERETDVLGVVQHGDFMGVDFRHVYGTTFVGADSHPPGEATLHVAGEAIPLRDAGAGVHRFGPADGHVDVESWGDGFWMWFLMGI